MRQPLEAGRCRVLRARKYREQSAGAILRPPAPTQHAVAVARQYLQCLKSWNFVQRLKALFYGTAQSRVGQVVAPVLVEYSFQEPLVPVLSFPRVSTYSTGCIRKGQRCEEIRWPSGRAVWIRAGAESKMTRRSKGEAERPGIESSSRNVIRYKKIAQVSRPPRPNSARQPVGRRQGDQNRSNRIGRKGLPVNSDPVPRQSSPTGMQDTR